MTGFEPTPQGFADLHTDLYTTLSYYLVEILGFEPSAQRARIYNPLQSPMPLDLQIFIITYYNLLIIISQALC